MATRGQKRRAARKAKRAAKKEAIQSGSSRAEARVAGRAAKARSRGREGRAGRVEKRGRRREKIKEKLVGKDAEPVDQDVAKVDNKVKKDLKKDAKKKGKTAEAEAQSQLDLAAGLGAEETDALLGAGEALSEADGLRVRQLGAAKLQQQRAAGTGTLISDLEQDFANAELNQQAAVQAAGTGPLGQAFAANTLASSAGEAAQQAAFSRSREVADSESNLLGTLGSISNQDLAQQRITQGIQVAQMQNAVQRQNELTTGSARLQLGAEEDLFRSRQAELEAQMALRLAEMNRPKKKGILGGLAAAGGAVIGGIFGGGQGAAAGGQAGQGVGDFITDQTRG